MNKCERKNINQPIEWWQAFQNEARRRGMSLSAYLGEAGKLMLPRSVRINLDPRGKVGKPRKESTMYESD